MYVCMCTYICIHVGMYVNIYGERERMNRERERECVCCVCVCVGGGGDAKEVNDVHVYISL